MSCHTHTTSTGLVHHAVIRRCLVTHAQHPQASYITQSYSDVLSHTHNIHRPCTSRSHTAMSCHTHIHTHITSTSLVHHAVIQRCLVTHTQHPQASYITQSYSDVLSHTHNIHRPRTSRSHTAMSCHTHITSTGLVHHAVIQRCLVTHTQHPQASYITQSYGLMYTCIVQLVLYNFTIKLLNSTWCNNI